MPAEREVVLMGVREGRPKHKLTPEERRRGGLSRQARLRADRYWWEEVARRHRPAPMPEAPVLVPALEHMDP